MFKSIDVSILPKILGFLPDREVRLSGRVSKDFHEASQRLQLFRGPDGGFVDEMVKLNNKHFELRYGWNGGGMEPGLFNVAVPGATTCEIIELSKPTKDSNADHSTSSLLVKVRRPIQSEGEVDPQFLTDDGQTVDVLLSARYDVPGSGLPFISDVKEAGTSTEENGFGIFKVLKQVHPDLSLSGEALDFIVNLLLQSVNAFLDSFQDELSDGARKVVALDRVHDYAKSSLTGELTKHALSEINKAVLQFRSVATFSSLVVDKDLVLTTSMFRFPSLSFEAGALEALRAYLEYLLAEVLELSGNAAKDNRSSIIKTKHILLALENDAELKLVWNVNLQMSVPQRKSKGIILKGKVIRRDLDHVTVATEPFQLPRDYIDDALEMHYNDLITSLYEEHQNRTSDIEGVVIADDLVREDLRSSLMRNIDVFASTQPVDYHPNSNGIVRDHVHPGLFSYVEGVSTFMPSNDLTSSPDLLSERGLTDQWGRKYESSRFQWLPTYIEQDQYGHWRFRNEINNLPRAGNEALYHNLEKLFSLSVPHFEAVVGYGRALGSEGTEEAYKFVSFDPEFSVYDAASMPAKPEIHPHKLAGSALQVICKIVDYELQPGQSYEGVWHVEGMSHENIVATADFILSRDKSIEGGDLLLKRGFLVGEGAILGDTGQDRIQVANEKIEEALVPLGRVPTKDGRLIVFPNSHVHKVTKMTNTGTKVARRRIVVFFLINPDIRIVSTQEVPKHTFSRDVALAYRLELMQERKFHKQDWNVREISLCEH